MLPIFSLLFYRSVTIHQLFMLDHYVICVRIRMS